MGGGNPPQPPSFLTRVSNFLSFPVNKHVFLNGSAAVRGYYSDKTEIGGKVSRSYPILTQYERPMEKIKQFSIFEKIWHLTKSL